MSTNFCAIKECVSILTNQIPRKLVISVLTSNTQTVTRPTDLMFEFSVSCFWESFFSKSYAPLLTSFAAAMQFLFCAVTAQSL